MLVSQKLAIAAHMHVLLRRKTGRVTDTEWLAENLDYALEIVRFARAKADEDGHPDLREWADKLERAVLEPTPVAGRPLVQSAVHVLKEKALAGAAAPPVAERTGGFAASTLNGHAASGFGDSLLEPERAAKKEPNVPRYVGGIR
jgi:hypothetical protein